jgi:hypothetical protein
MLQLRYTFPIKLQDIVWLNNGAEKEQVEETMVILKNGKRARPDKLQDRWRREGDK